jgi:hypothetical protein
MRITDFSRTLGVLAIVPGLVCAQSSRTREIPLKSWPAPLFWQPAPAEAKALATEQAAAVPLAQAATTSSLAFVAMTPCRVVDTRGPVGAFGGPGLVGGVTRSFPLAIPTGNPCPIPANAQAYSLNVTVVPAGPLGFLTIWPQGIAQPAVSTLNDTFGQVLANAAVVPAGSPNGGVNVFALNNTDLVIDINGFYTQAGTTSGPASLPVGSVVYSMLDAATFSAQQSPGETWVLADGRSIAGLNLSYENLTHSSVLPNLLGVFIRGKNNGRNDGNQNPDGELAVGQFTADRFLSHNHGGGAHTHATSTQNGAAVQFGGLIVRIPSTGTFNSDTTSSGIIIATQGGPETSPKSVTLNPFIRVN